MADAPVEKITVKVNGKDVVLDPKNMQFNELTLSDYMDREYGWIDYLGKQLEFANKEVQLAEIASEAEQAKRFIESKDAGNTDNYAKAFSLSHSDVVVAKQKVVERKEVVGLIKAHLKAWDKNHDNAQNRGHTLRKELDKLNKDIFSMDEAANRVLGCAEEMMGS
jgi:hypothetical protein